MGKYTHLLGVKFTVHGRSIEEGFDCYGLLMYCYKMDGDGVELPEIPYKSLDQNDNVREKIFQKVKYIKLEKPVEKCIIEIEDKGLPTHVARYIGDGKIIHATRNKGVVIEPLRFYERRIRGLYKVENSNIQKSVQ